LSVKVGEAWPSWSATQRRPFSARSACVARVCLAASGCADPVTDVGIGSPRDKSAGILSGALLLAPGSNHPRGCCRFDTDRPSQEDSLFLGADTLDAVAMA
jgi:hypothetical protein